MAVRRNRSREAIDSVLRWQGKPQMPAMRVQTLVDGTWVTTGRAPNLEAAARHARAMGGLVRAKTKTKRRERIVAAWRDGRTIEPKEVAGGHEREES